MDASDDLRNSYAECFQVLSKSYDTAKLYAERCVASKHVTIKDPKLVYIPTLLLSFFNEVDREDQVAEHLNPSDPVSDRAID